LHALCLIQQQPAYRSDGLALQEQGSEFAQALQLLRRQIAQPRRATAGGLPTCIIKRRGRALEPAQ